MRNARDEAALWNSLYCPHVGGDVGRHCDDCLAALLRTYVREQGGWRRPEDEMPPDDTDVWVAWSPRVYNLARRSRTGVWYTGDGPTNEPDFWMPPPPLPEEE